MKKTTILWIIGMIFMLAACVFSFVGPHICFDIALIAGGITLLVVARMKKREKDEQSSDTPEQKK